MTQEILNETLVWNQEGNNLDKLHNEWIARTNGRYSRFDQKPTRATEMHGTLIEKETGMPIAKYAKDGTSHSFAWHPDFIAMHPKLKDSIKHGKLNDIETDSGRRKRSKEDMTYALGRRLQAAHADNYQDRLTQTKENLPAGFSKIHYHDEETGHHVATLTNDVNGSISSVELNSDLIQHMPAEEQKIHKNAIANDHRYGSAKFDALEKFVAATKASKPYAVGGQISDDVMAKHFNIIGSPEEVSAKHESYLKERGYNVTRHTPTAFIAHDSKHGNMISSFVHGDKLHQMQSKYSEYSTKHSDVLR